MLKDHSRNMIIHQFALMFIILVKFKIFRGFIESNGSILGKGTTTSGSSSEEEIISAGGNYNENNGTDYLESVDVNHELGFPIKPKQLINAPEGSNRK